MVRVALLTAAALIAAPAAAHDAPSGWAYPSNCCSGKDCREILESDVTAWPGGWLVRKTGEVIPAEKTRQSPDGKFHRCSRFFATPLAPDSTICLFVPNMGM